MSVPFDRSGWFRGRVVDAGVGRTKNKFPKFVARVVATEMFDETTGEWVDWSEYDMEGYAHLVLFNDKGPIFHYDNLKDALGWDGASFRDLATTDWSERTVAFQVEHNVYEGKESFQVRTIQSVEASMGGVQGLGDDDLASLDAEYASMLAPKKVSAPTRGKKATPKKAGSKKSPTKQTEPKASPPPPPTKKSEAPTVMDKLAVWEKLFEDRPGDADDDAITSAFIEVSETLEKEDDGDWTDVLAGVVEKLTAA